MKLACSLFFALIFCAATAEAQTTYYVSKDGDDAKPCSEKKPCLKLGRAVQKLTAGDTLIVKAGIYRESLNDVIPSGNSWSQPVTIKANPGDRVVVRPKPSQAAYRVLYFANPDSQYIVVDGLTIDARNVEGEAVKITTGANHIRIQNCEILRAPTMGILITDPSSTHNEIINCAIHEIGRSVQLDHAVYISTSDNLVEGCRIYDVQSHGIHLYGHSGMDHNIFRSNFIYSCRRGIGAYGGSGNMIYNNVIYDQMEYGILLRNDAGDLDSPMIYNNTIYNAGNIGIYNYSTNGPAALIRNNIAYDHAKDIADGTGVAILERNLAGVDPKFVDIDARDLHLKAGSPAIDSGETLTEVTSDKDGIKRPHGSAYDLGAFEYSGTTGGGSDLVTSQGKVPQAAEFDYRIAVAIGLLVCGFGALVTYKQMRAGRHRL